MQFLKMLFLNCIEQEQNIVEEGKLSSTLFCSSFTEAGFSLQTAVFFKTTI